MEKEQTGGAETRVTMNNYTKEDIIRLVEEEDVEFIRLQFTDLFGNLKNIAVTASQLDRVLNNKCMFDGSAIDGFARIEESDMYLYPDLSTLEIFPWRPQQGKVARMICDVYRPNGQPFEGDPRYVLKRAVQQAEDMGYTFEVGPECEFFLFNTDENTMPTTNTHEQAGYFDIGPLDFGENARRDIVMNLEDMGFVIEASHHEMAPAQHEIDFRYDEALHTADNIMTFSPADAKETAAAWYSAITSEKTPTALVLTRQNLPQLAGTGRDAVKGAYIVADSAKETPDAIIIATGSELSLAVEAKELLLKDGMDVRVVSMPCMDLFEEQSPEYKESVLPKAVRKRVAVEALSDFGWGRYVGLDGATVCMEGFGASGPAAQLFKKFGFTAERVAETVKSL